MATLARHVSISDRQCWVCFGTPEDDEEGAASSEWTSPCRCCGGTQWVHQTCLQLWVDQKQKMSSSVPVSCPQCQYTYQIQYPTSNIIVHIYDYIERALTTASPMTLAGLTAAMLYWSSFTYGITAATLALGRSEAIEYFKSPESTLAIVCLPIVPWAILAIKIIRPEVIILRCWYRYVLPHLARVFKNIPLTNKIGISTRSQNFYPAEFQPLPYVARSIVSVVSLPFVSSLIGHILFRYTDNGVKRTLMGGALYLLMSYSLKIALEHLRGRVQ